MPNPPSIRRLTIRMLTVSGAVNRFYAFLDGDRVIAADGTATPEYSQDVSQSPVRLKVRVFGIDDAEYLLAIDLPGTAADQELTLSLFEGYHELELTL